MIKLDMVYTRSTKNTHVYNAVEMNKELTTLYFNKKPTDDGKPPIKITVTINHD